MSWRSARCDSIGVDEGRGSRDRIESPLEAGLGVIRPRDEAMMRKNHAIAIGQFSNDLAMPGASVNAADGYGTDSSERNLVSFRRRFEPCPGARP